jgi:hypothetical protein
LLLSAAAVASKSTWFPEQQVQFDSPSATRTLQLLKPIGGEAASPAVEPACRGSSASSAMVAAHRSMTVDLNEPRV